MLESVERSSLFSLSVIDELEEFYIDDKKPNIIKLFTDAIYKSSF